MPSRKAGAPRLIEATGERIVPWARDAQVIYEHFHRYLWAQPLVAGRRVLDLGSGEGFGAALLADAAEAVTGVDIDERTVEHSRANYAAPNLAYTVASATDLAAFADDAFDAVVAFEMIEHVADHDRVLDEIARVLAQGGLVVMSTPERHAYSEERDFTNPFHERELSQDEFTALLRSRFAEVSMFAQRAVSGSRIEALAGAQGGHLAVAIERAGEDWRVAGPPLPLYVVAVASDSPLPPLPDESSLFDYGLEVLAERQATLLEHVRMLDARQAELVAASERAQRAEDEARRVQESVSWRALERVRGIIGEKSFVGRHLRALMNRVFRLLR
jgi:O-antigen biosynthesis protein